MHVNQQNKKMIRCESVRHFAVIHDGISLCLSSYGRSVLPSSAVDSPRARPDTVNAVVFLFSAHKGRLWPHLQFPPSHSSTGIRPKTRLRSVPVLHSAAMSLPQVKARTDSSLPLNVHGSPVSPIASLEHDQASKSFSFRSFSPCRIPA